MTSIQTDLFLKKLKPQHIDILNYMRTHNGITVRECSWHLNCTELRSRLSELKSGKYGFYKFTEDMEYYEPTKKWHKRYFLT